VYLDQLVARNLRLPRKRAAALIARGGLTRADGAILRNPRISLAPESLPIAVHIQGRPTHLHAHYALLLNKPLGCVSALRDTQHETVLRFVQDAPLCDQLRLVGRLDKDTSGLLLLTTQGDQVHALTHPKKRVPRTYEAALARPFAEPPPQLVLADGHVAQLDHIETIGKDEAHPALAKPDSARLYARISLHGGAYHEVRRIMAALGSHVLALCRVSHGHHTLPRDLGAGHWLPVEL